MGNSRIKLCFGNLCWQVVCLTISAFGLGLKLGCGGDLLWFNVTVFVILCVTFAASALMLKKAINDFRSF